MITEAFQKVIEQIIFDVDKLNSKEVFNDLSYISLLKQSRI